MKRQIFLVCLFYCFFRLPIYESIAAIFWQSVSYVLFYSRTLFDFLSDFFTLKFFILIGLNCSHSEIKLVGISDCERQEIKAFLAEWLSCQTDNLEVSGFSYAHKTFLSYTPSKFRCHRL